MSYIIMTFIYIVRIEDGRLCFSSYYFIYFLILNLKLDYSIIL